MEGLALSKEVSVPGMIIRFGLRILYHSLVIVTTEWSSTTSCSPFKLQKNHDFLMAQAPIFPSKLISWLGE